MMVVQVFVSDSSNKECEGSAGFAVGMTKGMGVQILRCARWTHGRLSATSAELVGVILALKLSKMMYPYRRTCGPLIFLTDSKHAVRFINTDDNSEWNEPLVTLAKQELGVARASGLSARIIWTSREDPRIAVMDTEARDAREGVASRDDLIPPDLLEAMHTSSAMFSSHPAVKPAPVHQHSAVSTS